MLRLELRGAADDDAARANPQARDGEPENRGGQRPSATREPSQSFAVLADRLTVESGRLSLWQAQEVVFRCPVSALLSIAFEALDDPRPAPGPAPTQHRRPHAGHGAHPVAVHPDGPRREAPHHDLASANTRWTTADERRLLELRAAGLPIDALARTFGRREGAVRARLFKLRHAGKPGRAASAEPESGEPSEDSADGPTG